MTIALKRKLSFDERVNENREQILNDHWLMEQIEDKLEMKKRNPLRKNEKSG